MDIKTIVNGRVYIIEDAHVIPGDPLTGVKDCIEYAEIYEACSDDLEGDLVNKIEHYAIKEAERQAREHAAMLTDNNF